MPVLCQKEFQTDTHNQITDLISMSFMWFVYQRKYQTNSQFQGENLNKRARESWKGHTATANVGFVVYFSNGSVVSEFSK